MHIADKDARAKALKGADLPLITRTPAIVMTAAGPRSPAGRYLKSRFGVSPSFADTLADLAGFRTEADHD